MISCANCGTLNRKGSSYCSQCGQHLDAIPDIGCPACNRLNPPGSNFCHFCGASLSFSAVARGGGINVTDEPLIEEEAARAEPDSAGAAAPLGHELPAWLYEESRKQTEAPSPAVAPPGDVAQPVEQVESKYLQGIHGLLPRAGAWLPPFEKQAAA